jgi:hypothetical protein
MLSNFKFTTLSFINAAKKINEPIICMGIIELKPIRAAIKFSGCLSPERKSNKSRLTLFIAIHFNLLSQ